jgi:hypothetical protein
VKLTRTGLVFKFFEFPNSIKSTFLSLYYKKKMKFGKTLLNNQIPEWSRNYISYKALKGTIKQAATKLPVPEDTLTCKQVL